MSFDRFNNSSHWLPSTAAPAGSGGSTAGRSPQQQSLPPPPPPLMRSPGAALPSHPHASTAPVPTSTLASTSLGADASLPHASLSPHTGGSASAAVKYVDASSMAAVRNASGSPSGFRVVNTSSAPFSFAAQSSNAYRPPRRQSYQQQQPQPQASRAPVYGAAPISSTGISGHTTDSTNTGSKSVNEVPSAHVVQVPIVVGASSSSSGGGEEHYSGGAAAHSHWRGGGSGGRSSHSDYTRRRSAGGHSDVMQGARRQPATQQRFQQQQQQSFGRQRGGGGHMYGQSLPLEALTEMSHPLAAEGGESHHAAPELPTTSAATSLTHSAGSGRTGRRGSGVSSGSGSGSVGGSALPHAAAAVDSPFTHQHPQQHQLVAAAASAAGGLPASSHGGGDGVAGTGTSPASSTVPQQHQLQQPISRSAVSASSATTTTTAAAAATMSSGSVVGGARYTRPHGEERPTVALSLNVLSVYQTINEIFYQERQKLLAAPVKYAAARTYEDTAGHYIPCEGEVIADRYVFKELVGQGSFGKVLHCMDRKYNEPVAVKVIRSGPYFESQGWFEAQVVAHLNNDAALQNLVVQLRKVFLWKGHMVLVFEPLSFSLYKLITLTKHNGVSLDLTRKFAFQIVKVLLVLEQHQPPIIHCDLKPENVLLQDPSRSGVRVIDFGSACYQQQPTWRLPPAQVPLPASSPSSSAGPPWDNVEEGKHAGTASATAVTTATSSNCNTACQEHTAFGGSEASFAAGHTQQQQQQQCASSSTQPSSGDVEVVMPKYIQSRYYRSPEVILELGYTTAIDRWSLGCFLTEMHTGRPLFQGNHEADMIAYFTMVLGPLPDYMIAASPKRTRLYHTCPMESGGEGSGLASAASTATTSSVAQAQHQLQRQQRAASPLLAFTAPSSPVLTPSTAAPGHAAGSPFFLRAAQVEDTASATAHAVREGGGGGAPLERVLGVHTGGPRGCRAGQPGHDEAAYKTFYDFIQRLLQYDPRKRMSCAEAMQHPFLEPIRVLEARAAAAAAAAAAATAAPPAHSDAVAAASPPPVVDGVAGGPTVTVALPPSSDAADV